MSPPYTVLQAEGGGKYLKRRGVSSVSSWFKSKDPLERRFAALVPLEWPDDDAEASSQDQDRAEGGGGSSSSSSLMRAIWKVGSFCDRPGGKSRNVWSDIFLIIFLVNVVGAPDAKA